MFQHLPAKRLLVLLFIGVAGVWFSRWEYDSPYISSEIFQQVYLTDEGLYMKPAMALLKTGKTATPRDANMTEATTPVHVWLVANLMRFMGVHWTVARWLSIFMGGVALVSFWSICRLSMNASMAHLATLAVATNFMFFHSIRLATADPTALGLSLLAVWVWAAHRESMLGLAVALGIGGAAAWAKPTYLPVLVGIGVAECASTWVVLKVQHRFLALLRVGILGFGALLQGMLMLWQYKAIARTVPYTHSPVGGFSISFGTGVRQMLGSYVFNMPILPLAIVMLLAAVAGFFLQKRDRQRELFKDPVVLLFIAWILVNTTLIGIFEVQPARYYFATIFGWTFLAYRIAAWNGVVYSSCFAVFLMLANLCVQVPFYGFWRLQNPKQSYIAISRDVASRIIAENHGGASLIGHGLADWIELFDPRIQALDLGYRGLDAIDPLAGRVEYWRPQYILVNEDDLWSNSDAIKELQIKCSSFWRDTELVAEYTLLYRNIFPNSSTTRPNLKLYRIKYMDNENLTNPQHRK